MTAKGMLNNLANDLRSECVQPERGEGLPLTVLCTFCGSKPFYACINRETQNPMPFFHVARVNDSKKIAWQNAAESLPAEPDKFCEDPYCFGDHCGLKINPKTELESISVESIGEPGDYACTQCHRPYTAKDVEGWTVKCPICRGHSGDPYSHEPFECAMCGGIGKVLAFPKTTEVFSNQCKPQPDSSSISTEQTFEETYEDWAGSSICEQSWIEAAMVAVEALESIKRSLYAMPPSQYGMMCTAIRRIQPLWETELRRREAWNAAKGQNNGR